MIKNIIKKITVQGEALEALQSLKRKKAQIRALEEDCKNIQKSLLEGFGLDIGDNADIVNGNGQLVGTWKTIERKEFLVPAGFQGRLTIKTS